MVTCDGFASGVELVEPKVPILRRVSAGTGGISSRAKPQVNFNRSCNLFNEYGL